MTKLLSFIAAIGFFATLELPAATFAAHPSPQVFDEETIAGFYRGKIVRIIVGFPPGGGADTYSRLIARHLGRFIPGNPTVSVSNMAGAGSLIAANHVFNAAAKDGTEIGMLNGAVILEQLFDSPGIHFDMAKFRYLAVPVNETYVMVVTRRSGITKFSELLGPNAKQAVIGAIPSSTLEHAPILLRDALGANLKVVSGYKGSADIRLAIDSGEINGFFNPWSSVKHSSPDKFKGGDWLIIVQLSDHPLGDLPSSNVPTISDLTRNEADRLLLRYGTSAPNQFGKVYVFAPGVPSDRAAAVEGAFTKVFADKNFLTEAEKGKLEISPIFGGSIKEVVNAFLGLASHTKTRLKKTIRPGIP